MKLTVGPGRSVKKFLLVEEKLARPLVSLLFISTSITPGGSCSFLVRSDFSAVSALTGFPRLD